MLSNKMKIDHGWNGIGDVEDISPITLQWIGEQLKEAIENSDIGHDVNGIEIEPVEYQKRDGFLPFTYNRGGLQAIAFVDLDMFNSTGHRPASVKARNEIERLYNKPDCIAHDDSQDVINGTEETYYSGFSVMLTCQWLYHGKKNGRHYATVSAAINFESPYHRIKNDTDWKEIQLCWRTNQELLKKTRLAIAHCSEAIL